MLAFAALGSTEFLFVLVVLCFAIALTAIAAWVGRTLRRIEQCHAMLTELVQTSRGKP